MIYLDFAKAFNSVPHNELLLKLYNIRITCDLWKSFKGYLTETQQCVHVGNSISRLLPAVPQSSILDPLLLLVFLNDLQLAIQNVNTGAYKGFQKGGYICSLNTCACAERR